jgi:hypothetical protein
MNSTTITPACFHSFAIYLPTKQKTGEPIDNNTIQDISIELLKGLCEQFGGATTVNGVGNYLHDNGTLAVELVTIITVFTAEKQKVGRLAEACLILKDKLNQESFLFRIDEDTYFV